MPVILDSSDTARTTVNNVIRRALLSLGVLRAGESSTPAEAADALDTLNDMLNSWRQEGIDLEHLDLALADNLPYPDDHILCFWTNLAVLLAPQFGVQVSPIIGGMARRSYLALRSQYMQPDTLGIDQALRPIYNRTDSRGFYEDITG